MEFDGQNEEQEEEVGLRQSYESLQISSRANNNMSSGTTGGGGGGGPDNSAGHGAAASARRCKYRECLKNHALGLGVHAVDGCGEFMPAGEEGTLDALKCAACNCHRNFHRKETEGSEGAGFQHPRHQFSPFYRSAAPAGYFQVAPHHRPLALPSTSGGGHSREDQEDISNPSSGGSRKRFRTKFTQEQKDKMLAFAESLGWRIQKQDEAAVQQFCNETSVKRHVLKVWMHNNKHTLGKKP